ncbi:MAG: GatB/YqeY domain-containing protein [Bacteroidia bacterium]|nr:GatB/YqeY domain-containing protein [Bacteroidia bacterium]
MSLFDQISNDIKAAMLARESGKLEALRSIKAAMLLAKTEGANSEISHEKELSIIQKLFKQRKESAEIYTKNNRQELADKELFEAGIIEQYLPKPPSDEEITTILKEIIEQTGAKSPAEMGKVMGVATKRFAGTVDGKIISEKVKQLLSNS